MNLAKIVLDALDYDKDSGVFRRKWRESLSISANRRLAGKVAGGKDAKGYIIIDISGKKIKAHRAAWLFAYGDWPDSEIDHIDGDKENNRISNLRLATRRQNNCNVSVRRDSSSGVKGVRFNRDTGKWSARIKTNGSVKYLGSFSCLDDAAMAYANAAILLNGEFAKS